MATLPTYALTIGYVAGSMTDITSHVQRLSYGRALASVLDSLAIDQAMFEMNDISGQFSPKRGSLISPGQRISLTATFSGTTYGLFYGQVKAIRPSPIGAQDVARTVIEAVSDSDRLSRQTITTSMFVNMPANSLFTEIMSRSAVASFSADALYDTVPFAWYRDRQVGGIMDEFIQSGQYIGYIDGFGTFRIRNRTWGFGSVVASYTTFYDLQYALTPDRVLNSVKVNAQPRIQDTAINTVAILAAPIAIPASGYAGFWLTYADPQLGGMETPVGSFVTLVSSQDFYAAVNSDGSGTNLTATLSLSQSYFGSTVVTTVFNGTGTAGFLTRFQVRGYPVRATGLVGYSQDDSSSQALYGKRGFELTSPLLQNYAFLTGFSTSLINDKKNAQDDLSMTLLSIFPDVLAREVGDAISVVNSVTGVNSIWAVWGMQHDIDLASGLRHQVRYDLRFFPNTPWLVLDHSVNGVLDNGRIYAL